MSKYSGTKTEKNLMEAFAGESMARNKYTYFASVAKKAGYEQIAAIFQETADQEKEHAKMWFKELSGIGNTAENLLAAAEGETVSFKVLMISDENGIKTGAEVESAKVTATVVQQAKARTAAFRVSRGVYGKVERGVRLVYSAER